MIIICLLKEYLSKDYKRLLDDKSKPLFNRLLLGQYPPGSTIKPFFGIVALEEGV
jgi:penicillin-binding protein 2